MATAGTTNPALTQQRTKSAPFVEAVFSTSSICPLMLSQGSKAEAEKVNAVVDLTTVSSTLVAPKATPTAKKVDVTNKENLHGLNRTHRYVVTATINKALFGIVYLAFDRLSLQQVAVKISSKYLMESGTTRSGGKVLENNRRHHAMLRRMQQCDGISPKTYALPVDEFEDDALHYSITEYLPAGDLFNIVTTMSLQRMKDDANTKKFCLNIARAIQELHASGIAHCDLSLENVCVSVDGVPKLIDFATVAILPGGTFENLLKQDREKDRRNSEALLACLTPIDADILLKSPYQFLVRDGKTFIEKGAHRPGKVSYMSPELYIKGAWDPLANDVWGFGVMLYSIIVGHPPFNVADMTDGWFRMFMNGTWRSPAILKLPQSVHHNLSNDASELFSQIFCHEDKRITIDQVVRHPWFTSA